MDENTVTNDSDAIVCSFTRKEMNIIAEALTRLQHAKIDYLDWKTDEYSQRVLPIQIKETIQVIWKVHDITKDL